MSIPRRKLLVAIAAALVVVAASWGFSGPAADSRARGPVRVTMSVLDDSVQVGEPVTVRFRQSTTSLRPFWLFFGHSYVDCVRVFRDTGDGEVEVLSFEEARRAPGTVSCSSSVRSMGSYMRFGVSRVEVAHLSAYYDLTVPGGYRIDLNASASALPYSALESLQGLFGPPGFPGSMSRTTPAPPTVACRLAASASFEVRALSPEEAQAKEARLLGIASPLDWGQLYGLTMIATPAALDRVWQELQGGRNEGSVLAAMETWHGNTLQPSQLAFLETLLFRAKGSNLYNCRVRAVDLLGARGDLEALATLLAAVEVPEPPGAPWNVGKYLAQLSGFASDSGNGDTDEWDALVGFARARLATEMRQERAKVE